MTIIDTPGILAGDKQLIERGYDFTQVIEWFAERADLILLMFDSHKLDISNEFKMAIHSLKGQEEKVRVVLNKSDMVSQQQLMRVYGAMMWSLGKVVQTPEVMRVYLSSFWTEKPPNCFEDCRDLIEAESKDLLRDLKELRRNAAIRKINEIVKRARLARVHALIISHLKKEMPSMFGKKKKQEKLLENLGQEFVKIQQRYHLPSGDFPNPERFRQNLSLYDMDKFKSLKEDLLEKVDEVSIETVYVGFSLIVLVRLCQMTFLDSCHNSLPSTLSLPKVKETLSKVKVFLALVRCHLLTGTLSPSIKTVTCPNSMH